MLSFSCSLEPGSLLVWIHRYRNRWLVLCQDGATTSYVMKFREMFHLWSKTGYCNGSETLDEHVVLCKLDMVSWLVEMIDLLLER